MLFPDSPAPDVDLRSFPDHYEVHAYFKKYCEHFKLGKFIQFGKLVEQVLPVSLPNGSACSNGRLLDSVRWRVTTKNLASGERSSEDFDFVFICSG